MTELSHYGVKGMKWGVRRDHAVLDRLAGRKSNPGGRNRAERKANKQQRNSDWKNLKKSTTRGERKQLASEARSSKLDYIVNTVMNEPTNTLVSLSSPMGGGVIVRGETFVDEILKKGRTFDVLHTDLADKSTLEVKKAFGD